MKKKVVLIYSGGLDSTVLLAKLLHDKYIVHCLNFDYGSKHNKQERKAAKKIAMHFNVPITCVALPFIGKLFNSSLLKSGGKIPEGHYAAESMKSTVVPFRNGIMLSIAVGFAESLKYNYVALASHAGDHSIYPDCRPAFTKFFKLAAYYGTYNNTLLIAPFNNKTKTEIAAIGAKLALPLHLTWSCYKGEKKHCGKCGACNERGEAFRDAGIKDLTAYK